MAFFTVQESTSERYEDVLAPRPRRPPSLAAARQPLAEPGLSRYDVRRSRCSEECEDCEEEEEFDTASSDEEGVHEEPEYNSGPNKRRKTTLPPPHPDASSASALGHARAASHNDLCSQAMSGASSELDGLRELSVTPIRSLSTPARSTLLVDDARHSNEECV